ncbi:uncharacterized protein LOC141916939 isoform X1 [Strix aluco]|uniref:uncharacterized protein LOC141916939 isoform X1 n=3 Tax=Strix aluco TaxID=111821 RepID=UPI003DA21BFB
MIPRGFSNLNDSVILFRGPRSSVLPGGLCLARCRGCRAGGSGRGPRGGCPRGALVPVTSQRRSHRGMSPGCQPAAPAAVRLGPATMAVFITRVLTLLSIVQYVLRAGDRQDAATQELLRQHEEQEQQEMTRLMEEVEQSSQERRGLAPEGLLLGACQHWWFWASADALLVLLGLYWLPRQSGADGDSSSQRGSASGAEEQRGEDEDCEGKAEPSDTLAGHKPLQKAGSSVAPAKQARPNNSLLTGPHPALGQGSAYECPQNNIPQRLLLAPPRPPLGHIVRQRWAPRGLCRQRAAAPPAAPDGERAAPPPLPREHPNTSRVPASRAASDPLRWHAAPARRRRRASINTQ